MKKPTKNNSTLQTLEKKQSEFVHKTVSSCAIASSGKRIADFDTDKELRLSEEGLELLSTNEGIQLMLSSQMLAIHQLQQTTIAMASMVDDLALKQYYINATIKLTNTFTQQAATLHKLQNTILNDIKVGHMEVHNGGQAIVGNINTKSSKNEKS